MMVEAVNVDQYSPWISEKLTAWSPLIEGKTPLLFRKNSVLFHQGQSPSHVYIVKSGRIRIACYQQNGAEKHIYIIEHGGIVGESGLNCRTFDFTGIAIVDSHVYCVPHADFEAAMQASWDFTRVVLKSICRKNSILFDQVISLSFAQALQRVAQVLLYIAEQYGKPLANETLVSLKFSHQDISHLVNASRVTVNNIFTLLTEMGAIKKRQGTTISVDKERLRQVLHQPFDKLCPKDSL